MSIIVFQNVHLNFGSKGAIYRRTYSSSFGLVGLVARDWPFNLPAQSQCNYGNVEPCFLETDDCKYSHERH